MKTNTFKKLDNEFELFKIQCNNIKRKINTYYSTEEVTVQNIHQEILAQFNNANQIDEWIQIAKSIKDEINQSKYFQGNRALYKNVLMTEIESIKCTKYSMPKITSKLFTNYLNSFTTDILRPARDELLKIENPVKSFLINELVASHILNNRIQAQLLENWINEEGIRPIKFDLIMERSYPRIPAVEFHQKIGTLKPVLILVKTTDGKTIGGFTDQDLSPINSWKQSSHSFLFSIDDAEKYPIKTESSARAIYTGINRFVTFGNGEFDIRPEGGYCCDFGKDYDSKGKTVENFIGSGEFAIEDLEVFHVRCL